MTAMQVFTIIFGSLGGIGIFAFGGGYFVSQWRKGSHAKDADIMSTASQVTEFYKNQNDDLKSIMAEKEKSWNEKDKDWNVKFTELTKEVGVINGKLEEKSKQADQYLAILQNRDPETKQFMEMMIQATKDQAESHKGIMNVLNSIHLTVKPQ